MTDIPDHVPATLQAGDTLRWYRDLPDYPASAGWELTYVFLGPATHTIAATADGDRHVVQVDAVTSKTWEAGGYTWQASVSKDSDRYTVGHGHVDVRADLATAAAGYDPRSHARRVLEAIEAVLEGRADSAVNETTINGRSIQFIPFDELLKLRDRYRAMVRSEDDAASGSGDLSSRFGKIMTRFVR